MDKINLIIPSAGYGRRFIDAGYDIYKPLINALGKPMVLHSVDAFPENTDVWIITDDVHQGPVTDIFRKHSNVKIIAVAPHKNGPAWSLMMAADKLPQNEACFIAYNDLIWNWDFNEVLNFISANHADGLVFTQKCFHPHLFKNNYSAFCRTDNEALLEIKEKGSFSDDWMNEELSTGVFYFANTAQMLANIQYLVDNNIKSSGEYFPSEIYNVMLKQGLSVYAYKTDKFLHIGIPEQLEDAEEWRQILNTANKPHNTPTLVMMCGTGERMKLITSENKAGLSVDGQPMCRFIAEKNNSSNTVFLVNDLTKDILDHEMNAINIHVNTSSQTESLKMSSGFLKDTNGLLVLSTDCYGIFDEDQLKDQDNYAMVLFGFKTRLMHRKQGDAHSGFSYSGSMVTEIHLKCIKKNDLGLAGMYYFPDPYILKELENCNGSHHGSMDHFAQFLMNKKYKVGFVKLQHYLHLGTPEEYYEYLFWKHFFIS